MQPAGYITPKAESGEAMRWVILPHSKRPASRLSFHFFKHQRGWWAKKVRGKLIYFSKVSAYPQVYNQQPGTGFPIARVGAIISLSCGAILNLNLSAIRDVTEVGWEV
jgi:hypothetical protein